MLSLYYGGSEIPGWRELLTEAGVKHMALSYMGLRRRTKFVRPWVIADRYADGIKVFLDSGTYNFNGKPDKYSDAELVAFAEHYYSWANENFSRLEMVSEFDARQLGPEWLGNMRAMYAGRFAEKFMPIWNPADGLSELERLATLYKRVGIPQTDLGERDLTPVLNGLVRRYNTLLHGVAMTKVIPMHEIPFATVSSTSWLTPSRYGDTQIWAGGEMKRYPKAMKQTARTRHFRAIQQAGFDADKILADSDSKEVLRLAVWSWERCVEDVNRHRPEVDVVTASPNPDDQENTEQAPEAVNTPATQTRNFVPRPDEERRLLPFLQQTPATEFYTDENGVRQQREGNVLGVSGRSLRRCNSCYINQMCDAFTPDSDCVYEIPISLKTPQERSAVNDTIETILLERIMIGYAFEQANGGYPDPNVSAEVDRYGRFRKMRAEAEQQGFKVTVEARASSGELGMIGRIFGRDAGEQARALEAPQPTDDMLAQLGIVDAELVEIESPAFNAE
jgi:hypothetical protein